MNVFDVKTTEDFRKFVTWLDSQNFDHDKDYYLYNQAFENAYGHPPFDENDNLYETNNMKLKEFKETSVWKQANIVKYFDDETGEEIDLPKTESKWRKFLNREVVDHGTDINFKTGLVILEVYLK